MVGYTSCSWVLATWQLLTFAATSVISLAEVVVFLLLHGLRCYFKRIAPP